MFRVNVSSASRFNVEGFQGVRLINGIRAFSRIFFGRPNPIHISEEQPDGSVILTFNHSFAQLFFYFRRFAANEALVLEPKRLADEIKTFHEEAWKAYKQGKPIKKET